MASATIAPDTAVEKKPPAQDPPPSAIHDAQPTPKATSKSSHKPFPSISGGCVCNTIRYRLLTSPLFVYACHCPDCQKLTGSAFGMFLNIELSFIQITSQVKPVLVSSTRRPGFVSRDVVCPSCATELWSMNAMSIVAEGLASLVVDVKVGTLDFPGLMEPDIHSHVESKVDWLILPPHARTVPKDYSHRNCWPKSSLQRLDACLRVASLRGGEGVEDGEKTPTGVEGGEAEDDEAFEKRFKETEKGLQERLEALRRKLEEEEGGKKKVGNGDDELEKMTAKLDIGVGESDDR